MLAGPTSTIFTMRRALGRTIGALNAASMLDMDRTDEDRAFFAAEKAKLLPIAASCEVADNALTTHDLGPREELQAGVEIGDQVLDRGVRAGNARTKLGLKGKSGLDATHVFGQRINDIVDEPVRVEPQTVLGAVAKLDDVPDFAEKAAIKADLKARADQQNARLDARDAGYSARTNLESACAKAVMDGANALIATQAELTKRFPRQRPYVASFFLDVSSTPSTKKGDGGGEGDQGAGEGADAKPGAKGAGEAKPGGSGGSG